MSITDALAESGFLKSKGEARRALKETSIAVNNDKVNEELVLSQDNVISEKYILLQRGKKNYSLLTIK
jgi:tyrosyl-tRNA synthetase